MHLVEAIQKGDRESAIRLIISGYNVNERHENRTALMCASEKSDYDMVKLLLRHGAKIDIKTDSICATALILAIRNNERR